ncbi:hypothetical protein EYF80_026947 [Liparis tanakae]|uniref:Uncharacterized protein n=1 Tax=Liparis tanakae TaxID=230148 RepID=A0A4Z2HDK8_9TELE|nr:hypothetical protein EYF80_026947 [Liparis tanakae]
MRRDGFNSAGEDTDKERPGTEERKTTMMKGEGITGDGAPRCREQIGSGASSVPSNGEEAERMRATHSNEREKEDGGESSCLETERLAYHNGNQVDNAVTKAPLP